ncbi:MAG: sodium:solute symporter family protein [Planctomycetaceae bacterium]|nr:sodium:solute symporter family protein [Planctomycetaceae bacterium]
MSGVYWGGVAAIAGLYAFFLGVGWLAARKSRDGSASDLILAGRAMPLWIATLTMTATWVDGGYILGTAQNATDSLARGVQGGLCFGISLILGGIFFARRMRELRFTTLVDLFRARFGPRWAAVLAIPAMLGEIFWSAELLVAIGASFSAVLNLDLGTAILISAGVVTLYTMLGGMWSVAYTDAVQLALVPIGLLVALPWALDAAGGFAGCIERYYQLKREAGWILPPLEATGYWSQPMIVSWWDTSLMLVFGGIPWNCYFQRVLSCRDPVAARWHSIIAGSLTILLTIPPLLLGMAAVGIDWPEPLRQVLSEDPSLTLPLLLRDVTPYAVGVLGLTAIVGAVTSSFSSSILSAGSMIGWNVYRGLLAPDVTTARLRRVIRGAIVVLGIAAALMALRVQNVADLWFFTSDLVFVLLFPQLVMALFDPRANRYGSIAAFAVSLVLRLGAGEPLFGWAPWIPYPELFAPILPGSPADWYDSASGAIMLPVKTLAAVTGLVVLPVVSRLTARRCPPRALTADVDTTASG